MAYTKLDTYTISCYKRLQWYILRKILLGEKNENEGEEKRETRIKIDEENVEYSRYTSVSRTRDTLCF